MQDTGQVTIRSSHLSSLVCVYIHCDSSKLLNELRLVMNLVALIAASIWTSMEPSCLRSDLGRPSLRRWQLSARYSALQAMCESDSEPQPVRLHKHVKSEAR